MERIMNDTLAELGFENSLIIEKLNRDFKIHALLSSKSGKISQNSEYLDQFNEKASSSESNSSIRLIFYLIFRFVLKIFLKV